MNSTRLISGRVPVTDLGNLTADRYQFLGLNQAEPNLGNGTSANDVLRLGTDGVRVWTNAISLVSVTASGNVTANVLVGNSLVIASAGNIAAGNIRLLRSLIILFKQPVCVFYVLENRFDELFS